MVPIIGDVKLSELRRRDARNAIDEILRRGKPVEATRVFEDLRAMVRWGVANEYLDVDPLSGASKPATPTARNRVLTDDEINSLWNCLSVALARSPQCQTIIRLCLVTGQRVGEIAGMRRSELDFRAREWRLPGERVKNGHAHTVPLSDLALELIGNDAGDIIFPYGNGSFPPLNIARVVNRANRDGRFPVSQWSTHDLRRTVLTGMARLGVAPIVLGHVANHRTTTRAGITLSVYSQYTYDREKRAALDLWAERLRTIVDANGATILPLRAR